MLEVHWNCTSCYVIGCIQDGTSNTHSRHSKRLVIAGKVGLKNLDINPFCTDSSQILEMIEINRNIGMKWFIKREVLVFQSLESVARNEIGWS